jgi:uncharacterized protein YdeI (YjbR/CyaY-like superfamily)
MAPKSELPILQCESQSAWAAWLAEHHPAADGVWLKFAKKDSGVQTVTYAEAVEEGLCFGWIDGQTKAHDDKFWLQRFTPRRKRSRWSRINRDKAERLIESNRMQPSGLVQVEAARADGRWEAAYEPQRTATVPDDLKEALEQNPRANEFFSGLTGANRYAILYRINDAKRPQTRAKRIADYVAMCAEHSTLH